jgi:hypothetical protein
MILYLLLPFSGRVEGKSAGLRPCLGEFSMRYLSVATSMVAIVALLNATAAGAREFDTVKENVSLPVSAVPLVTTAERYPVNSVYWPCPLDSRGTAPDIATSGFLRVGWDHKFEAGTPPFACQYRLNHVQRIALNWNQDPISKRGASALVDNAVLSFDKRRVSGDHECADQILTKVNEGPESYGPMVPGTEDRWELKVPMLTSADCTGSRCKVDVKSQVNDWLRVIIPNQGLVVRGDQERLDANDNVSCLTEYGNFKLDVAFRYDVKAGTIPTPILKGPLRLSPIIVLNVSFVRKTVTEAIYDLRWNVVSTITAIDIYRNGTVVRPATLNTGNYRDRAPFGPVRYKVCQASTTNCSSEVAVTS